MACEILVPHLGIEPAPLAGEARSLNHWTAGEVLTSFAGGSDSEESACDAGDLGSILGSRRSPREGNGYLLLYSCPRKSH